MKKIRLTRGYFAVVDDSDYPVLSQYNWYALKRKRRVYAAREVRTGAGRKSRKCQYMHHMILAGVKRVDHRDGDSLNNRRLNLRPSTQLQNNQAFKLKPAGASSTYRGVTWNRHAGKWQAAITVNYKSIYLGIFRHQYDAAFAYDAAARHHFKDFASPNFL